MYNRFKLSLTTLYNMIHKGHISHQFDRELANLESLVVKMGKMVEASLKDALRSVFHHDGSVKEREIRQIEEEVNHLEILIDQECLRILAIRHPIANDLRFIITVSKITSELEAIGDEVQKLGFYSANVRDKETAPELLHEVQAIGEQVRRMLHRVLKAFARCDTTLALQVSDQDRALDQSSRTALRAYISQMMEDPRTIKYAFDPIWMIRALERMSKHTRQCANHIIYLASGKDIRHSPLKHVRQEVLDEFVRA